VASAFTQKLASVVHDVGNQVMPLHQRSDFDGDRLTSCSPSPILGRQPSILLQHKLKSLFQVSAGFGQGSSLRVYSGHFFNPGDVPPSALLNHGRKLAFHI
jgi:hypothetical protein